MNITLIRTMDSQGRIVIPAEIRKQMKLSDGDALELENVGTELLLRKCPARLNGKEEMSSYLSVLYSVIHCGIAICSENHILVSAGHLSSGRHSRYRRTRRIGCGRPGTDLC